MAGRPGRGPLTAGGATTTRETLTAHRAQTAHRALTAGGVLPQVTLLDATAESLDEDDLRRRARELRPPAGASRASRSYCHPLALVAWHDDRVGVDIERVQPCDERFGHSICTPSERAARPWRDDRELISLWASKEALSKALGDALRYDPRRLESPIGWPDGACGPWRARALDVGDGHRAWICWHAGSRS